MRCLHILDYIALCKKCSQNAYGFLCAAVSDS